MSLCRISSSQLQTLPRDRPRRAGVSEVSGPGLERFRPGLGPDQMRTGPVVGLCFWTGCVKTRYGHHVERVGDRLKTRFWPRHGLDQLLTRFEPDIDQVLAQTSCKLGRDYVQTSCRPDLNQI
ncbi:hypothetical protein NL108_011278 [Boleophthalmus pectinirostris]|nr:hypothetical protein NL108_011278 [Boleophthalmus pectinirostris]